MYQPFFCLRLFFAEFFVKFYHFSRESFFVLFNVCFFSRFFFVTNRPFFLFPAFFIVVFLGNGCFFSLPFFFPEVYVMCS